MGTLAEEVRNREELPPPPLRRAIRERAGATQERLADELGVSAAAVSRWETVGRGGRRPSGSLAERYAELLRELQQAVALVLVPLALLLASGLGRELDVADERQVYTPVEVARLLGMGRTAVYDAIRARQLPSRRVGRRILIPRAELDRWLGKAD